MLKEKLIRVGKAMILVGFVVAVFVTAGCNFKAEMNGHWKGGLCVPTGHECMVTISVGQQ